jgi:hypothetical protein
LGGQVQDVRELLIREAVSVGGLFHSAVTARDHAYLWVHLDEETVSCLWHALDENEREHPKAGKRDRDEETIGNEFFKCPHDPNPVV